MSSSIQNLDHLKIPLEDIRVATNHFSDENFIRWGGFGKVYKGKLLRSGELIDIVARRLDTKYGKGSKEFWTEISMLSKLEHGNLVSLVGFCDEKNEKIVINKYEARGSLDNYITDPTLTWGNRLNILVGITHALSNIHYDEKRDFSVIHRNIKSSKILLDYFWIPKLSGFNMSMTTVASRRDRSCIEDPCGTIGYADPTYVVTGSVTCKSDIYSFGVVLFEALFGKKAIDKKDNEFAKEAKSRYENEQLDDLINPYLRTQMDGESLKIYSETAYHCLNEDRTRRPNIHEVVKKLKKAMDLQWEHANRERYQRSHADPMLEKRARQRRSADRMEGQYMKLMSRYSEVFGVEDSLNNRIQISDEYDLHKARINNSELPTELRTVAIQRFFPWIDDTMFDIDNSALMKYTHRNILPLLGYSCDSRGVFFVYEHPSNGSLADHLESMRNITNFTWVKRIKICIDIAEGLNYIHTSPEYNEGKLHRNISSRNILFKENGEAVIGVFSVFKRPEPLMDYTLGSCMQVSFSDRKEIDIFHFGIILIEILCWRFADDPIFSMTLGRGLVSFVRRCFKNGTPNKILDLKLMGEAETNIFGKGIAQSSLDTFSEIAYRCLGDIHLELRPTTELVLKELKRALCLQESLEDKNNLRVSLADIKLATQDFSHENLIGKGGFGKVYRGKFLSERGHKFIAVKRLDRTSDQGETELKTEFAILSEYKHMNVIDLVSYCNENGEKVIVYDYASKGSLDKWLKCKKLTWRKRLEICVDIARGLDFLHGTSDVKQEVVIHRDIKSANILLHDDWKASIADFGFSLISPINQDINYVIDKVKGTHGYCDPQYITTGFLTKESDIYSFGVLLFEMLCGRFVIEHNGSRAYNLIHLVRRHSEEGTLYKMVFEATKKQMASLSLTVFQNIAYQCIHEERSKRPTAYDVLIQLKKASEFQEKWEDLNISLDDIMLDTQDFSHDNLIGKGDFWSLYKGRVKCADGCETIAAKRLDRRSDQRETERMAELEILFEYTHENIISLVGHCYEKGEKVMVYDYASISKGSLDRWLKHDGLTWRKRLEICIDIAKGLAFLHGTSGAKQEVVIHGDIKSENVLLNDDWKAKIANFGQSLIRPSYCDPLYTTTGVLTKESDIYSLGVLLFEMLCGRSVMEHNSSRAHNFIHFVRDNFEEGTLYDIVFEATKKQMVPASLTAFQNIAYQCIHEEKENRPTAEDVLIQLKEALEFQEDIEIWKPKLLKDYKIQMPYSPEISYGMSYKDLYTWLHERLLHREHKVFFSYLESGGVEMISATEFEYKSYYRPNKWRTLSKSRFREVVQISDSSNMFIQISIKTQLLSPGVNYGVYLVYKFCCPSRIYDGTRMHHRLTIKMGGEYLDKWSKPLFIHDGWMRIELDRFSNLEKEATFDAFLIRFYDYTYDFENVAIYIEGVEFRPISKMSDEEIEELEKVKMVQAGLLAVKSMLESMATYET